MLKNNLISDIIRVIKFSQNRGLSLKETTEKALKQERGFIGPLMKNGLSLMENVLTKSFLIPFGLMAVASATDATIKKNMD